MKTLFLHCDFIRFKALKKALKDIDKKAKQNLEEQEVKDTMVVLIAAEKTDTNISGVTDALVKEVKDIAKKVSTKKVVLYPYAHLSQNLSNPDLAMQLFDSFEKALKKEFDVTRAPFGYYKEFSLKVKGHPLSELSREIHSGGNGKGVKVAETFDPKMFLHEIKQSKLDTSKLKKNDHRIVGQEMELFFLNQSSPGMVYWLPNGTIVYNELVRFWREEHAKLGYQETITPLLNKSSLYKISGHWGHYKENMFIAETDEGEYGVKAMNCPNAMIIFGSKPRSYKDLPLRFSDTDRLHRYELSGTLGGLLRVRSFQQDDSHNFVTEDMIKDEYNQIFALCDKFYGIFGMKYSFRLGTRPEKSMGDVKLWNKAEKELKEILKESGKKFKVLEGDGAFYGPKVDILMEDSLGREWQMGTIQLDMQMPSRFGLKYVDKNNKEKVPIVIHRVIYGSLERFIGILLEHTNGRLPMWLAPKQVRIINFTDRNTKYAQSILDSLKKAIPGLRVDTAFESTTVPSKVKAAEIMRIPYIVVLGDKEEKEKTLAVRIKGNRKIQSFTLSDFVDHLKEEIDGRK